MKIITLVENTSFSSLLPAHGLSLYIEANGLKILFDLGPSFDILSENAAKKGIDLSLIDYVVISHGHYDHGGALVGFSNVNSRAKIFINKNAFGRFYNVSKNPVKYIGLDPAVLQIPGIVKTDDGCIPFEGGFLFTICGKGILRSSANDVLCKGSRKDSFSHEQNLIITEKGKSYLFCGCGHKGIANIMKKASPFSPVCCVGGFHLSNPSTGDCVSDEMLEKLSKELSSYKNTEFYTCHCTGQHPFDYLSSENGKIHRISCGDEIFF